MLHINTIRATRNRCDWSFLYYLFVLLTKFLLAYSLNFFHFLLTVRWFCFTGLTMMEFSYVISVAISEHWAHYRRDAHRMLHRSHQSRQSRHLSFIRLRAHCSFQYENQSTREERSIGSQSVNHGNLDQIRPNNVILERTKIIIWSR